MTFLQNDDSLYVKIEIFLLIDIFQILYAEGNSHVLLIIIEKKKKDKVGKITLFTEIATSAVDLFQILLP